ncbi:MULTISPECIES: DUF3986 family protein [Bacillaceae]|uniref:DUF3986 family protein n=1 Tax=Metabacillus sediminis TaxID=3117746 RepID=A0ABZ2NIW1_9BACI|nr:DUF3986 family protein [Bacillus sp. SJS]KZZ84418.1 hypothetical protein AS29_011225 [Bacillus sp. SJS]
MLYDDRYHLHLGYYKNGFDLEAIAYKRQSQEIWDIFFDFEQYDLKNPVQDSELSFEHFGTRIFSVEMKELDYDYGAKQFEQWLYSQKIVPN